MATLASANGGAATAAVVPKSNASSDSTLRRTIASLLMMGSFARVGGRSSGYGRARGARVPAWVRGSG